MFLLGGLHTACTDYQDEIDALDYRVTQLEELVDRINTNIEAMKAIVGAIGDADYITGVKETPDGYIINFAKAGIVEIKDGVDGKDGKDAEVPEIDVAKGPDGIWYWVVNGVPITGEDGQVIRVNGKDGKDGKDAVSPQVRINPDNSEWEISTDGGKTWLSTGSSATNGKDANEFFMKVTYSVEDGLEYMVITTKSGQTFRIPIVK